MLVTVFRPCVLEVQCYTAIVIDNTPGLQDQYLFCLVLCLRYQERGQEYGGNQ